MPESSYRVQSPQFPNTVYCLKLLGNHVAMLLCIYILSPKWGNVHCPINYLFKPEEKDMLSLYLLGSQENTFHFFPYVMQEYTPFNYLLKSLKNTLSNYLKSWTKIHITESPPNALSQRRRKANSGLRGLYQADAIQKQMWKMARD